jgi:hypothetical protein
VPFFALYKGGVVCSEQLSSSGVQTIKLLFVRVNVYIFGVVAYFGLKSSFID